MRYIFKAYYTVGLLFICLPVFANQHKATGVHGMVLLQINQHFYASHLPLAHSIHAQQVVFRLSVNAADKQVIKSIMKGHHLVTLMPERFDLHRLMDQNLTSFKTDIFAGHFERGGSKVLSDVRIHIDEIILSQPMPSAGVSTSNGVYYQRALNTDDILFIHKIATNPSFDHIFLGKITPNREPLNDVTQIDFKLSYPATKDEVQVQLSEQGIIFVRTLYLESQDFTH
ncbi:hypothetical protein [uncultured Shewanella sp.]|uniref:hypothetical protein n=1 Tax=uncultured Shewanella sp. TaxID=173975 RepID=UPI0026217DA7|nr:hypothetical protein [uncultured Shewanella sp.]